MKRTWTIIGVSDVATSFNWYQSLFGQPEAAPGHDYWGQICDSDGTVLLCLHQWGSHEHPRHGNERICAPRSRRLSRHGQRARLSDRGQSGYLRGRYAGASKCLSKPKVINLSLASHTSVGISCGI